MLWKIVWGVWLLVCGLILLGTAVTIRRRPP
jgi:hypothetical protein